MPGGQYELAPVSGSVSMDGEPLAGVQVNFFPQATAEESAGPFSSATTDENGRFTLKSRYGDDGAVIGLHQVSIKYEDSDGKISIPEKYTVNSELSFSVPEGGSEAANFTLSSQ